MQQLPAELVGGEWRRTGDPSESALLVAAARLGEDVSGAQAERESGGVLVCSTSILA